MTFPHSRVHINNFLCCLYAKVPPFPGSHASRTRQQQSNVDFTPLFLGLKNIFVTLSERRHNMNTNNLFTVRTMNFSSFFLQPPQNAFFAIDKHGKRNFPLKQLTHNYRSGSFQTLPGHPRDPETYPSLRYAFTQILSICNRPCGRTNERKRH